MMTPKPSYDELEKQLKSLEEGIDDRIEVYRNLVENINDVAYRLDTTGRFTYINQVIEYKTGFKPEEVVGRHFTEFIHPEDLDHIKKTFKSRVGPEDIPPTPIDFRAKGKTGDYLWVRASSRRVKENGRVIGLAGVWRDITGRRQAEEALRRSHEKLEFTVTDRTRELTTVNNQLEQEIRIRKEIEVTLRESESHFKSLKEGAVNYAVYRLAYSKERQVKPQIVFVSPSIRNILGVSQLAPLDEWFNSIHPEDEERIRNAHIQAVASLVFDEIFRIHNNEEWRWIHAVANGVPGQPGRMDYIIGIMIDITEQKRAEEKLKEREHELSLKSKELRDVNTTLQVLLQKIETSRTDIDDKLLHNINDLVIPNLDLLKTTRLSARQKSYLEIIESQLLNIMSPFSQYLSENPVKLTASEIHIANLIRQGKITKEIANILSISYRTVESHRKNIRKKLGLNYKKANLRAYLLSIM